MAAAFIYQKAEIDHNTDTFRLIGQKVLVANPNQQETYHFDETHSKQ